MYCYKMPDIDEETLNRLAAEALLEEAKNGARRAAIVGPSGWVKKQETVNKRFLHSTLRNAVLSNRHRQSLNHKRKDKSPLRKSLDNKEKK